MENGKKPAFSIALHDNGNALHKEAMGLTKREYFAGQALVGLMVQAIPGGHNTNNTFNNSVVVKHAVDIADAILAELEKTKSE
jgi:hypothetical protein